MRASVAIPRSFVLPFILLLGACGQKSDAQPAAPQPAAPPVAMTQPITTPEVHDAICGCKLQEVRRCGNYVELAGRHVELVWPALGKMEYCKDGEKGARIEITGEMKDKKFVAASYRRVD